MEYLQNISIFIGLFVIMPIVTTIFYCEFKRLKFREYFFVSGFYILNFVKVLVSSIFFYLFVNTVNQIILDTSLFLLIINVIIFPFKIPIVNKALKTLFKGYLQHLQLKISENTINEDDFRVNLIHAFIEFSITRKIHESIDNKIERELKPLSKRIKNFEELIKRTENMTLSRNFNKIEHDYKKEVIHNSYSKENKILIWLKHCRKNVSKSTFKRIIGK